VNPVKRPSDAPTYELNRAAKLRRARRIRCNRQHQGQHAAR
jgi:hypothetical protein